MMILLMEGLSFGPSNTEDGGTNPGDVMEVDIPPDGPEVQAEIPADSNLSGPVLADVESEHFTENLGQWEDHVLFLARTPFGHAAFGEDGVFYYIVQGTTCHAIKIAFVDADMVSPIGRDEMGFTSNYFFGNNEERWVTEARSYKGVLYKDVWPDIDILYYFMNGHLKYDIILDSYADPDIISFQILGHEGLSFGGSSLEILIAEDISISDTDLVAFHDDGTGAPIRFRKTGESGYGFDVERQEGKKLIIDPVIFCNSTYIGGSGSDTAKDVAVDGDDNIIIAGSTSSADYPNSTGAFNNTYAGGMDIVITKMNPDAGQLIFSTYIGDWSGDYPQGVEVDEFGDIYVTGETWSWYFPTTNGSFQDSDPSMSYPDAFVLKLNSAGSDLIYSTYVGGTQSDGAKDIKVRDGYAYVVGNALSYDFPTVGQPVNNAHGTIFFFIMNQDGTNLTNSAFWGGWSNEFGHSVAIDDLGDVLVGGVTYSQDFPTTDGAYQTSVSDMNNGFILKYRPSTNTTIFSSYLGGDSGDNIYSIDVDGDGFIYMAGTTSSGDEGMPFPATEGAYDRTLNGSRDLFIAKMDPTGSQLAFSTYIGSQGDEDCGRIDVDEHRNIYLTGAMDSDVNFTVTPGSYDDTYNGWDDAFLLILDEMGSGLRFFSYLGGSYNDTGKACYITDKAELFVLGSTSSLNFPVTDGAFQTENNGYTDMFVTKFRTGNYTFLHPGWNLVSTPLVPPDINGVSVLSPISGMYSALQRYDAADKEDPWRHISQDKPFGNDPYFINHLMGFWIHITEPGGVLLEFPGTQPSTNQSIELHEGWNLAGFPSLSFMGREEALNNLTYGTDVDAVWTFDGETQEWEGIGPLDYFEPGRGYWIHAARDCSWDVPL